MTVGVGAPLLIDPESTQGAPNATFSWSRSPRALAADRFTTSGDMLMIEAVQSSDRGVYTVTATNMEGDYLVGRNSASINVFINCKRISIFWCS